MNYLCFLAALGVEKAEQTNKILTRAADTVLLKSLKQKELNRMLWPKMLQLNTIRKVLVPHKTSSLENCHQIKSIADTVLLLLCSLCMFFTPAYRNFSTP